MSEADPMKDVHTSDSQVKESHPKSYLDMEDKNTPGTNELPINTEVEKPNPLGESGDTTCTSPIAAGICLSNSDVETEHHKDLSAHETSTKDIQPENNQNSSTNLSAEENTVATERTGIDSKCVGENNKAEDKNISTPSIDSICHRDETILPECENVSCAKDCTAPEQNQTEEKFNKSDSKTVSGSEIDSLLKSKEHNLTGEVHALQESPRECLENLKCKETNNKTDVPAPDVPPENKTKSAIPFQLSTPNEDDSDAESEDELALHIDESSTNSQNNLHSSKEARRCYETSDTKLKDAECNVPSITMPFEENETSFNDVQNVCHEDSNEVTHETTVKNLTQDKLTTEQNKLCETNTIQENSLSVAKLNLNSDALKVTNLKIKLQKFKELNRTWQSRKQAEENLNTDRTNLFDSFSADLPTTSAEEQNKTLKESTEIATSHEIKDKTSQQLVNETAEPESNSKYQNKEIVNEEDNSVALQEELRSLNLIMGGEVNKIVLQTSQAIDSNLPEEMTGAQTDEAALESQKERVDDTPQAEQQNKADADLILKQTVGQEDNSCSKESEKEVRLEEASLKEKEKLSQQNDSSLQYNEFKTLDGDVNIQHKGNPQEKISCAPDNTGQLVLPVIQAGESLPVLKTKLSFGGLSTGFQKIVLPVEKISISTSLLPANDREQPCILQKSLPHTDQEKTVHNKKTTLVERSSDEQTESTGKSKPDQPVKQSIIPHSSKTPASIQDTKEANTKSDKDSRDNLTEDEMNIKLCEIFNLQETPKKDVSKNKESFPQCYNESLMDVLNLDSDYAPSIQPKPVPLNASDINWPGLGAKRCARCGFTTSDEAMLQVHSCRRPSLAMDPNTPNVDQHQLQASAVMKSLLSGTPLGGPTMSSGGAKSLAYQSEYMLHTKNLPGSTHVSSKQPGQPQVGNVSNQAVFLTRPTVSMKVPIPKLRESLATKATSRKIKIPSATPKVWYNTPCKVTFLGNNKFFCCLCNYSADSSLFMGHLVEHMEEYPYSCPYCTASGILLFQHSAEIKAHIESHQGFGDRFNMFGCGPAKAFMERVAKSGYDYLSQNWRKCPPSNGTNPPESCPPKAAQTNLTSLPSSVTASVAPLSNLQTLTKGLVAQHLTLQSKPPGTALNPSSSVVQSIPVMLGSAAVMNTNQSQLNQTSSAKPMFFLVPNAAALPITSVTSQQNVLPSPSATSVQTTPSATSVQTTSSVTSGQNIPHATSHQTTPSASSIQNTSSLTSFKNIAAASHIQNTPSVVMPLVALSTVSKSPSSIQPTQSKPVEASPSSIQPTQSKPVEASPSSIQPTQSKPVEASPSSIQPTQSKPVEVRPSSIQPTQSKPVEEIKADKHSAQQLVQNKSKDGKIKIIVGIMNDFMVCQSCNYLSSCVDSFRKHIWDDLHEENTPCPHNKAVLPSFEICPHVTGIMQKLTQNSCEVKTDQAEMNSNTTVTDPTDQNTTKNSETTSIEAGVLAPEDDDDDCQIIEEDKPQPICVDLTVDDDDEEPSDANIELKKILEDTTNTPVTDVKISTPVSPSSASSFQMNAPVPVSTGATGLLNHDTERPPPKDDGNRSSMFYVCGFENCLFSSIMSDQFKHHILANHRGAPAFPCAHCGYMSPGEEEFFRHMNTHTSAKMFLLYKCAFSRCKFGTNLISEFQQHNEIVHKDVDNYPCASCKTEHATLSALIAHFQSVLLKFIQCPYCTVKSKDRRTILTHIGLTHPGKPRQITVTSQLSCQNVNKEVRRAQETRSRTPSMENACKRTSPVDHDSHTIVSTSSDSFDHNPDRSKDQDLQNSCTKTNDSDVIANTDELISCTNCSFKTSSDIKLKIHTAACVSYSSKNFLCPICQAEFKKLSELSTHVIEHDVWNLQVFTCEICQFCTNQTNAIEHHMKHMHIGENQSYQTSFQTIAAKEFTCKACPFVTKSPSEFNKHSNAHDVQTTAESYSPDSTTVDHQSKYSCPVCKKGYSKYGIFRDHISSTHTEVKKFTIFGCGLCTFKSSSLVRAQKHWSLKHFGEPDIVQLTRKIKKIVEPDDTNTNVDYFHCDQCDFSSNGRPEFLAHKLSHDSKENKEGQSPEVVSTTPDKSCSGELPRENVSKSVICPECQFKFDNRVKLIRHMKYHKSWDHTENEMTKSPSKSVSPFKNVELFQAKSCGNPTVAVKQTGDKKATSPGKYLVSPVGSSPKREHFYSCKLCSYRASSVHKVDMHLAHCKNKPKTVRKCLYCNYKCNNSNNLYMHHRKEHKELPFKGKEIETNNPGHHSTPEKRKSSQVEDAVSKKRKINSLVQSLKGTLSQASSLEGSIFGKSTDEEAEDFDQSANQPKTTPACTPDETEREQDGQVKQATPRIQARKSFKCGKCQTITASQMSFDCHFKTRHGFKEEPVMISVFVFQCLDCGRRFRTKKDAEKHNRKCIKRVLKESERMAGEEVKEDVSCVKAATLSTPVALSMSQNNCKSPSPKKASLCKFCRYSSVVRSHMREHYYSHFDELPYHCSYCDYGGKRSQVIVNHIVNSHPYQEQNVKKNEALHQKIEDLIDKGKAISSTLDDLGSPSLMNKDNISEGTKQENSSPLKIIKPPANKEYDQSLPYHCKLCSYTSAIRKNLKKHERRHDPERLECAMCPFEGDYPYVMRNHFCKQHPGKKVSFIRLGKAKQMSDNKGEVKEPVEKSNLADKEFKIIADDDSESKLQAHFPMSGIYVRFQDPTNRASFRCEVCDFRCHSSPLIAAHVYTHMPQCFQCIHCPFKSYPSSAITDHIKGCHDGPIQCKYYQEEGLSGYNKLLASLGKPPYQMPKTKKRKLSNAVNPASPGDDVSGKGVKRRARILLSDSESEPEDVIKRSTIFCCHLCNVKIEDITKYCEHLSLHAAFMQSTESGKSKCGFCSFVTEDQREFQEHVCTHVSERPLKCSYCGYSCFSKQRIQSHLKDKHPSQKFAYSNTSSSSQEPRLTRTSINLNPSLVLVDTMLLSAEECDAFVTSSGISSLEIKPLSNKKLLEVMKTCDMT